MKPPQNSQAIVSSKGLSRNNSKKKQLSKFWNSHNFEDKSHHTVLGQFGFALINKQVKTTIKQHRRNQMKFNKWTLGLAAVGRGQPRLGCSCRRKSELAADGAFKHNHQRLASAHQ
jgi:hypothetical protein